VETLTTIIVMDQILKTKDSGTKTYHSMWQFFHYNNIHNKIECTSVNEWLDPQHGDAKHLVSSPQSFKLTNTLVNLLGASRSNATSIRWRKRFNCPLETKTLNSLLEVIAKVCQTPMFPIKLQLFIVCKKR
jgi:hypothetical protein